MLKFKNQDAYEARFRALQIVDERAAVKSVNGVLPDDAGAVTLTPANINAVSVEDVANIRGTFRINVTFSDGVYTADKTFDEIKAAYEAGQQPYVVYTSLTSNFIYTLADVYLPTDGSGQGFMCFERYSIFDDTLETVSLRIFSRTLENGSNIEKQISPYNGQGVVGIKSVVQTVISNSDGGTNVITVTKTDGTSSTFTVRNGSKGSTGATGATGAAGADGKTAYQYAVEGGYTGTETEFSAKMAAEIPTASSPEDGEVFVIVDDSGGVVDPEPGDSRTVLYNFDFTQGLTDSVSGVNAVLAGTAIQDADGVHLNGPDDQLKLSFVVSPSTHIEYDLKTAELAMPGNGRLLTFATSATAATPSGGLLWRNGNGWAFYTISGWGPTINAEEKTCMSGKTLTLSFDANLIASLYVDGVFWAKAPATFCNVGGNNKHYAFIGSANGSQSAYPVTVSAVRVYEGEYSGGKS